MNGDGLGDTNAWIDADATPKRHVEDGNNPEPDYTKNETDECGACGEPSPRASTADPDRDGLGDPITRRQIYEGPTDCVGGDEDLEANCTMNDIGEGVRCGDSGPRRVFADPDGDALGDEQLSVKSCDQPENVVNGSKSILNPVTSPKRRVYVRSAHDLTRMESVRAYAASADGCGVCLSCSTGPLISADDNNESVMPDGCDQCAEDAMVHTRAQRT